jgi:hypothetical protein
MSLIEANVVEITKKQYFYKLRAYMGFFVSLVSVQILAILFSFNGTMNMGTSDGYISMTVRTYSSEIIIIFTMIWTFIVAVTLTTRPYRNYDFTFISNRITSGLSNIAFILTVGIIGSITSILSGILLRVIIYLSNDIHNISGEYFSIPYNELLLSFFVTFLYMILLCSVGYLSGMLVQLFKPMAVLLPTIIIGILIIEGRTFGSVSAFTFFVKESSLFLFFVKVLFTVIMFLVAASQIQTRMEVRR